MRYIVKILLWPVSLVLLIVVMFARFLEVFSSVLLSIISSIVVFTALGTMIFFHEVKEGLIMIVVAFLISPLGIPGIVTWLIEKLDDLRWAIKSI